MGPMKPRSLAACAALLLALKTSEGARPSADGLWRGADLDLRTPTEEEWEKIIPLYLYKTTMAALTG